MQFANHIGWSDVNPFEVVKVVSAKCLEIRSMNAEAEHKFEELGFMPGGFVGHCASQSDQKWKIESDPAGYVKRIRLHANGQWKDSGGARYKVEAAPRKFYDFNF